MTQYIHQGKKSSIPISRQDITRNRGFVNAVKPRHEKPLATINID